MLRLSISIFLALTFSFSGNYAAFAKKKVHKSNTQHAVVKSSEKPSTAEPTIDEKLADKVKADTTAVAAALDSLHEAEEAVHGQHKEKEYKPGEVILGHIGDSHEWHFFSVGDFHASVPLPVILKDASGMHFFLSSKFHHEGKEFEFEKDGKIIEGHLLENGYLMNEHGKIFRPDGASYYDFSITKNVTCMFIAAAIMLWLFISIAKMYANNGFTAPTGKQSLLEPIILFVRDDIAASTLGAEKAKKFLPLLLTVFFFIWVNNLLGLIPGSANVMGNIAVTMVLALVTFIVVNVNGNKHYWHHIFAMPGVPKGLLLILTPVEILGVITKAFALMIRLFANITAGHMIILSIVSLIFVFGQLNPVAGWGVSIFSMFFTLFMYLLEMLVAALQAYVFTLLTTVFISAAIEEPHGHH